MMRWYMEFTSPHDFWPSLKNLAHYKYQADGRQLLLAITLHHRTKLRVCNRCRKLLLSASRSRLADFCLLPRTWKFCKYSVESCDDRLQSILLLEIRVFPTDNRLFSSHFSRPFSRRRRRWDWSRQQRVMRLIFSNRLFVAARQQDSDHNDSLRNRFL